MENSLEKTSNIPAVRLNVSQYRLTEGQKFLLNFIKEKCLKNEAINRDEVTRIYMHTQWGLKFDAQRIKGKKYSHFCSIEKKSIYIDHIYTFDEWKKSGWPTPEGRAYQWFRSNLGTVVMKGKLVVIPIIEE